MGRPSPLTIRVVGWTQLNKAIMVWQHVIFLGGVRENTLARRLGRASYCRALQLSDAPWNTMPDTKTSGEILHAEYDTSCNYDELNSQMEVVY